MRFLLHILFCFFAPYAISQQIILPDINNSIQNYEPSFSNDYPPIDGVNLLIEKDSSFPNEINGTSVNQGGIVYLNVDLDIANEIIFANNNAIYTMKSNGDILPPFPLILDTNSIIKWVPTVGDVTGDGIEEIIFITQLDTFSKLYSINKNGTITNGFPVSLNKNTQIPVLADVSNNGTLDIIIGENLTDSSSQINIIDGAGSPLGGFPFLLNEIIAATPAAGDIDSDLNTDIVVATKTKLWNINNSGSLASGFPYSLSHTKEVFSYSSPLLIDIDGDLNHEIIIGSHDSIYGWLNVIDFNGNEFNGWPQQTAYWIYANTIAVDIDNTGDIKIITGDFNQTEGTESTLYLFRSDGVLLNSLSSLYGILHINAIDINNDNNFDFFVNANNQDGLEGVYFGVSNDFQKIDEWTIETVGNSIFSPLSFGDMNQDGNLEALALTYEVTSQASFINKLNTNFSSTGLNFNPFYQLNAFHNGYIENNYTTNTKPLTNISDNDEIKIYPNPSKGIINIEATVSINQITILDLSGKIVLSAYTNNSIVKLDISDLPKGIYIIETNTGKKHFNRIIKN